MPQYLLAVILYVIPIFLLTVPFVILSYFLLRPKTIETPKTEEPDVTHLEAELKKLIENNTIETKTNFMQQNLQSTFSHIIAAYLKTNKQTLHGFHLFQLIFSLIKNQTEDKKIIKILRKYLPSAPTSHLYALLRSCREFLNIYHQDNNNRELLHNLNQNKFKSTLLYLEQKINQALNSIPQASALNRQNTINETAKLCLIFASFSQFYDPGTTEKILQLAHLLSPEFFDYWHRVPQKITNTTKRIKLSVNRD